MDHEWSTEANFVDYQNSAWFMDSGASHHVTGNYDNLQNGDNSLYGHNVTTADGNAHRIAAVGTSSVQTGPYTDGINLDHVLYVPALKRNLLFVGSLADQGHTIVF